MVTGPETLWVAVRGQHKPLRFCLVATLPLWGLILDPRSSPGTHQDVSAAGVSLGPAPGAAQDQGHPLALPAPSWLAGSGLGTPLLAPEGPDPSPGAAPCLTRSPWPPAQHGCAGRFPDFPPKEHSWAQMLAGLTHGGCVAPTLSSPSPVWCPWGPAWPGADTFCSGGQGMDCGAQPLPEAVLPFGAGWRAALGPVIPALAGQSGAGGARRHRAQSPPATGGQG